MAPSAKPITIDDGDGTETNIIVLEVDETGQPQIDPVTGISTQETPDGGVVVDFDPPKEARTTDPLKWSDNLVEEIDEGELGHIAADIIDAIRSDEESRKEWLDNRAAGIEMLGFRLEDAKSSSGPGAGSDSGMMSTVRHPLLQEAVIRFQSNASAELLPTSGPAKVRDDTPPKPADKDLAAIKAFCASQGIVMPPAFQGIGANGGPPLDDLPEANSSVLAEALEKDLNHYLTVVDKGYRSDTERMLFWVGFGGCGFKKVYHCPIRRMPISRSVDAKDLIINHASNNLEDCGRITHRVMMRRSTLIRMGIAGVYKNVAAIVGTMPSPESNAVDDALGIAQGVAGQASRLPEDVEYTIYECYCERDIKGFEHTDKDGKPTGLELPYRITIEKESMRILEIRRNWAEGDEQCLPKQTFVKYPFVPAEGFYEIGLLNILGNATRALTAAWRITLDAGMFANFPGFLVASVGGRQKTNEMRVQPGEGREIQTNGQPIGNFVLPLPYKEAGAGFMTFMGNVETTSQRVGGTAELQIGEGKQDAPVGTTLALIEQATKILAAVHIRLHAAQAEELQLLKGLLREDPEAFIRCLKGRRSARQWQFEELVTALDNYDLVPAADPNTPSHMHRIMKAVAVKQLQAASPGLYDGKAVDRMILEMIGISDPDSLFAPPQPPGAAPGGPPLDPNKAMAAQVADKKAQSQMAMGAAKIQSDKELADQDAQTKATQAAQQAAERAADRASRERVAAARERTEAIRTAGELSEKGIDPAQVLEHAVSLLAPVGSDANNPPGASPLSGAPVDPGVAQGAGTDAFGGPLPSARQGSGALIKPPVGWKNPI